MSKLPSDHTVKSEPQCSEALLAPLGDTAGGAAFGTALLFASVASAANECGDDPQGPCDDYNAGLLVVGVVGAAALFASAVYGVSNAKTCGDAREEHEAWKSAGQPTDWGSYKETAAERDETAAEKRHKKECDAWRAELRAAITSEEKLAAARRRPSYCQ